MTQTVVLTIAGSDSCGGAGIQADVKTFAAFGVHGATVITAVTAQNTQGVQDAFLLPPSVIEAQLRAVLSDLPVRAIKTGMLGNAEIVETVVRVLNEHRDIPLVVDPVLCAKSGDVLLDAAGITALKKKLIPRAFLVTPNSEEAAQLCGFTVDTVALQERAAKRLVNMGATWALVKGGHIPGDQAYDLLADKENTYRFVAPRIQTQNTHGTGCTLAAAITAILAKGVELPKAVRRAKQYVSSCIAQGFPIGQGYGVLDHFPKA